MRNFVLLFAFTALLSVSRADFGCAWYSPVSKGKNEGNVLTSPFDDAFPGTDFPGTTSISWPDGSGVCSGASDYYSWANAKHGHASTLIHEHYGPTITVDAGLSTSSAPTADAVPTDEAFSPSGIPSNAPEGEPLGAPNTQSLTSTFSTDGALASLMHYKSNDQLVGIFCLFVAGLAGAGAILL